MIAVNIAQPKAIDNRAKHLPITSANLYKIAHSDREIRTCG